MDSTHKAGIVLAALAALGLSAARPTLAVSYIYTPFEAPAGANGINAFDINDSGQIVGDYGTGTDNHSYIYTPGSGFTTLYNPATATGFNGYILALSINNAGQVVGGYGDVTGDHGFLYTPGTGFTTLDDPAATRGTFARGINNLGQVVGNYTDATGLHGFLYTPGIGYSTLTGPNDPGSATYPGGINDAGMIVGIHKGDSFRNDGFLYTAKNGFTSLAHPDAAPSFSGGTSPTGINDLGQSVGSYQGDYKGVPGDHGFLYTPATGFTPIEDPVGALSNDVYGINNSGEIVGKYLDYVDGAYHYHNYFATPILDAVPEASSVISFGALLLLGMGGLLRAAHKRRKTAA